MNKYSFKTDYNEGAHLNILRALQETNLQQEEGYGLDTISVEAIKLIKEKIQKDNADIHFISGGTQANLIIADTFLRPYESVIAAETGHVNVHEAGAIEFTGHKINTIKTKDGKLKSEDIRKILDFHQDEHMVKPKLVYISNTTEVGTVYTKKEMEDLSAFCKENNLYLYLDGARVGSAVMSEYSDIKLSDIAELTDAFYIGGTKNGALLGEAIVLNNKDIKENFRYNLKQKGALLAKGRILGIQFAELFKNDLFFELARHANKMAYKLAEGIKSAGYDFLYPVQSNQIFPILPNKLIDKLYENFDFYIWQKIDTNNSAIRLVTSWATKEEKVEMFVNRIKE